MAVPDGEIPSEQVAEIVAASNEQVQADRAEDFDRPMADSQVEGIAAGLFATLSKNDKPGLSMTLEPSEHRFDDPPEEEGK
jgi:hypothetical protein